MTFQQGYEDFVRTVEWSDADWLIESDVVATTTGTPQYGPFFVGHWHSLDFFFEAVARDHQIQVRWSNDSEMVGGTTSDFFAIHDGSRMHVVLPNRGRWVDVTFAISGLNPTHRLFATLTNRQLNRANTRADISLVDYDNVLIGIGATNKKYLFWTHPGKARFHITCGTACVLAIYSEAIGATSSKLLFAQAYAAGARDNGEILLSAGICAVAITNTGGVGANFFCEVYPYVE